MPTWAAAAVLLAVAVLFTFGEIWGEAARWGLRYELAPAHAQGQYLGVFASSGGRRPMIFSCLRCDPLAAGTLQTLPY